MFDNWFPMTEEDFFPLDPDEIFRESFEVVPLNLTSIKYLVWRTETPEVDLLDKYLDGLGKSEVHMITLFKLSKLN